MSRWPFTKGVHDLGGGCFAYLQPQGTWGWSNAGLVVDGDEALLVDTLFDLKLTQEMLDAMRAATPAARNIRTLVITHGNGDHTFGNQLVAGAEIVAAESTAEEMAERPPPVLAALVRDRAQLGEGAELLYQKMGQYFDFEGIDYTMPTRTFDDRLSLTVGRKTVELTRLGPAHTRGDTVVHVPAERVLFAGDIMFVGEHPVMWAGPIENWIKACDTILGMDVDIVVPGHGPVTDKDGVRRFKGFLEHLATEARRRYDAGMSHTEAANDIPLDAYADWHDPERTVINVASLYQHFSGKPKPPPLQLWSEMGRYRPRRAA
jgi:cyclase